jgi:hypothetical protein
MQRATVSDVANSCEAEGIGIEAYEDPSPPAHVSESGSPAANYAVLQLSGDQASLEHSAIPYDHAAAARRAEENQSPALGAFPLHGICAKPCELSVRPTVLINHSDAAP